MTRRNRSAALLAPFALALVAVSGCATAPFEPVMPPLQTTTSADLSTAPIDWTYALVIDASSSASTLQVFRWRPRGIGRLPVIEAAAGGDPAQSWRKRVKPGLSAYAGRPAEAAASLGPLVGFALERIGKPETIARTAVFLRATAGLRLLPAGEQAAILESVRAYLDSTPFGATSARVISGAEEGIYGWLSVNYVLGHLEHGGPFPTVGALDLGGASTQITFQPLDHPRAHGELVRVGDNSYFLYTRSYLGLGQDEAREAVDSPDCFPVGYPMTDGRTGRGDFDACGDAIRAKLAEPCSEDDEPCSLFGSYQPPVYGDFLALSVYAYAADFFGLNERMTPSEVAEAGRSFCATDWPAWVERDPEVAENPYIPTYCYAAAHIEALRTDGFGFSEDTERITAPLRVQGAPVDWTLGALVHELAGR